ncbi:uncharacterized protein LOC108111647 [Drosophila eugracilis]|uniref:uncharacterized protein LOC108111647 n=1 Tax=Drosophila eugracilis TaxID=29029 RepID=UPI001BDAACFC|nr:uncharacterized protein LOC108111647 [Drosophila eugracilis]
MSIAVLGLLCLCLSSALGLLIPQHYCDKNFRYATEDGGITYIGIFSKPTTLPRNLNFNWVATFEIQGRRDTFVSSMQTYPNKKEAAVNLLNGEPVEVFVRFVDITTELPKLTSLILNGEELCSNPGYAYPKTKATVGHHMFIKLKKNPESYHGKTAILLSTATPKQLAEKLLAYSTNNATIYTNIQNKYISRD